MKINNSILKQFNIPKQKDASYINSMSIDEILDSLKTQASRIEEKSDLFLSTNDINLKEDCKDIVASRLNIFVQEFIDLVIHILQNENIYNNKSKSLAYCISNYFNLFPNIDLKEKEFVNLLSVRNDITHDYFNIISLKEDLETIMVTYGSSALLVHDTIKEYCEEHGLLEDRIYKDDISLD